MDINKKIEHLQINVAALFDMLAGSTLLTAHLAKNVLTEEQKISLADWLAHQASESQEPGRAYLAQVGNALTGEARFVELIHLASRDFLEKKEADLAAGKSILA